MTDPAEPIMIPCEGAGHPGHATSPGWSMCKMCGSHFPQHLFPDHERRDILAMLHRGDFG